MDTLVLIDGNSIIYRAYFALPLLTAEDGKNVNAVYGFMNIFNKVVNEYGATHVAVAFDMRGKNFRKEIYSEYKANRKPMPDDLAEQMPVLENLLASMNIKTVKAPGVEADDILGTLARRFRIKTFIVSGDKDLLQLVDAENTLLLTKKGVSEVEENTIDNVFERYGYTPSQVTDYKGLRGDDSDNIPGVKGVGEKTAIKLLAQYGSVEKLYENIDEISGAVKKNLIECQEKCFMSKKLATIVTREEIACDLDECKYITPFPAAALEEMKKLRFGSIIKRLEFNHDEKDFLDEKEILISDLSQLSKVVERLKKEKIISLYVGNEVCFAINEAEQYKVEISDNMLCGIDYASCMKAVCELAECDAEKIVAESKKLRHLLVDFGASLNNLKYDVTIMDYLVSYRSATNEEDLLNKYRCEKCACGLLRVSKKLIEELKETDTLRLYEEIELPLSEVLFEMEREGVKVDTGILDELGIRYTKEIEQLTAEAYKLAGGEFNIQSPKQLSEVLFEKLGLPHGKKIKTGYSTGADVMDKIMDAHPIVPIIMRIRKLSKLYGTYIEGFRQYIGKDGIVHTTFNQTLTTTGRLSSSEPNLQNLPVRSDEGRELRKMFVPKYDLIIGADYSQIELRLLAHFSGDENLITAFNEGKDIHALVASELFGVPEELVTENMRRTAKAVNFGIIYGISEFGLGNNVGISSFKAKNYIKKYYERYPTISNYLASCVRQAKKEGFVTTITNRRRLLPEIQSSNFQTRSFAERAAMNMPLQGSAADIMKIAMIKVRDAFVAENLKSKIILQVHDELIVDAFNNEAEKVKEILVREMENAVETKVKLTVNPECGANLYEAK